jgi:8-oxo-dGTP diphosphatase
VPELTLHPDDDSHGFRFCPRCGQSLDRRRLKLSEPERLVCTGCGFVFYLDPKIAVGTIIKMASGKIVLVKRAIEPGYGKWVFPGGYVDRGEEVMMAAIREAKEEAGLDVHIERLIGIYSYAGRTPIIIVYAATVIAGELAVDEEGLEAQWFEPSAIPWDDLAFLSTSEALRDFLGH